MATLGLSFISLENLMPAIEILIARVNAFLYFSRSIVLVFAIFLPRHEVGIGQGDYFSGIRYIYAYTGER